MNELYPGRERSGTSTTDTAKDQASQVAGAAKDAAGSVADEARAGFYDVKDETQDQLRQLLDRTRDETLTQTRTQQQRVTEGVQTFAGDLRSMLEGTGGTDGLAGEVVRRVAAQAERTGDWLAKGPEQVLDDVRSFARRRPGTFLLVAAGAGVVVGRLSRGLKDASNGSDASGPARHASSAPVRTGADGGERFGGRPPAFEPTGAGEYPPATVATPTGPLGSTSRPFAAGSAGDEVPR
jgi:ElaB/YqjD/DUF883 family membrane-anchored ribosome-binding protein